MWQYFVEYSFFTKIVWIQYQLKVFELKNTEKVILLVSKFSDIQTISARRSDRDRSHARYTDRIGKFIRDLR